MKRPIGVFDSGIGGISVLKDLWQALPRERFVYYGDTAHAPYGLKPAAEVESLTLQVADFLVEQHGVKALVVACNTATSAAAGALRQKFSLPVIGMEPALKPAAELAQGGRVLVLGTPMTLRENKFQALRTRLAGQVNIIPLPCPGLVELIEAGVTEGPRMTACLAALLEPVPLPCIDAVVLGCTHYLFVRQAIAAFFRPRVPVLDGNRGTVRQVKRLLTAANLANGSVVPPIEARIDWYSSGTAADVVRLQQFFVCYHSDCPVI